MQTTTLKTFITTLRVIHFALMAGLLAFCLFTLYSAESLGDFMFENDPLVFILPCLFLLAFGMSAFLYKTVLSKIDKEKSLKNKLGSFQTAHITRVAPLDGVGLFGAVLYMQTNNVLFICISLLCFMILITLVPSKDKIERDLPL